jgi:exonuclease VII large subunit
MAMRPNVKSKKEDILQAFDELLDEKKQLELELNTKQRESGRVQDKKIVEAAHKETQEHIIESINNLQVTFNSTLRNLSKDLSQESEKLETLKEAIVIEENYIHCSKHARYSHI